MARILIVEDDASMREVLAFFLSNEGYDIQTAESGEQGLSMLRQDDFDLVMTDLKLGGISGLEVLKGVKNTSNAIEVIVITAYSTVETALEAIKKGAFDYVGKPFKLNELSLIIKKALEKRALFLENQRLRGELQDRYKFSNIIGQSKKMKRVFDMIRRVANTRATVLINGESGTGKELVARALHFNSSRAKNSFVVVNCGAIPEALLESELFGHVKGAFTGAHTTKKGLVEESIGGSLFLDEVGELPQTMQVKLLRFLQERKFRPVGGTQEIVADVRVLAATNKDLEKEVKTGNFREDLFYRLNVIRIPLPSLRERKDDIPYLLMHFLKKYSQENGAGVKRFSHESMEILYSYDYPGNVRELENIVEHAVAFTQGDVVTPDALPVHFMADVASLPNNDSDLPTDLHRTAAPDLPEFTQDYNIDRYLEDVEKKILMNALAKADGIRTEAAKILGISFRSIRYKLQKYGVKDNKLQD